MKRFLGYAAITAAFSMLAFGETFSGTVMDSMCAGAHKDATKHTTKCALACADSGMGLLMSDGTFVKFDKEGNDKAIAALKGTKKSADLKATVTGTKEGDTLKVDSISLD